MARRRIHVIVKGRVQGVFFRRTTLEEAERLGLSGFVKNRPDGSVEIEAEGSEEALRAFLDFCRRGPEHAQVEDVAVRDHPARGDVGFRVEEGG